MLVGVFWVLNENNDGVLGNWLESCFLLMIARGNQRLSSVGSRETPVHARDQNLLS